MTELYITDNDLSPEDIDFDIDFATGLNRSKKFRPAVIINYIYHWSGKIPVYDDGFPVGIL
jgi:hypothetical protein